MTYQDLLKKIGELVLTIPNEKWIFNDYGNTNHSFAETEVEGTKIKLTYHGRIDIEGESILGGEEAIFKYLNINNKSLNLKSLEKSQKLKSIYNKLLLQGDNSVTA